MALDCNKNTPYHCTTPFVVYGGSNSLPQGYDVSKEITAAIAEATTTTTTPHKAADADCLIQFDKVSFTPIPTIESGCAVERFLLDLRTRSPETFPCDSTAIQVLSQLTRDPGCGKFLDKLSPDLKAEVNAIAQAYWKGVIDEQIKPVYAILHDYAGGKIDEDHYELMVGVGHVRMIYPKRGKKKDQEDPEHRIYNGPLIEYRVYVTRSDDGKSLRIVPASDGRVKWNGEAKAALLYRGQNTKVREQFESILSSSRPKNLVPGDPTTYEQFMDVAADFDCNSKVFGPESYMDQTVHALPDDYETLVLAPGFSLYLRPKQTTPVSEDMRNLARAITEDGLELSGPFRGFIEKQKKTKGFESTNAFESSFSFGEGMLPLPATTHQRDLIYKAMKDDSGLALWRGPPG